MHHNNGVRDACSTTNILIHIHPFSSTCTQLQFALIFDGLQRLIFSCPHYKCTLLGSVPFDPDNTKVSRLFCCHILSEEYDEDVFCYSSILSKSSLMCICTPNDSQSFSNIPKQEYTLMLMVGVLIIMDFTNNLQNLTFNIWAAQNISMVLIFNAIYKDKNMTKNDFLIFKKTLINTSSVLFGMISKVIGMVKLYPVLLLSKYDPTLTSFESFIVVLKDVWKMFERWYLSSVQAAIVHCSPDYGQCTLASWQTTVVVLFIYITFFLFASDDCIVHFYDFFCFLLLMIVYYAQLTYIVAKKWDPGILDPSRFSAQIRKIEARLGKLAKIRKVETD